MKNLALLFLFLFTFAKVDAIQTLIDGVYYDIYFYNETASVVKAQKYSGEMVIHPSVTYEGKSYPVTAINEKAFYECTGLTGITIPTSIQTIGYKAFEGCKALKSVTIPNSVTGIGTNAFKGCISLISVTLPNSLTTISASTFYNCNALTSVIIPNSVTSIGADAFYNCESLASVNIPNSVKSIGDQAFWRCTSLTSIIIPASVKTLGNNSFHGCNSLRSAVVSAEKIDYNAFIGCRSLTSLELGDGVKEIGSDAFCECEKLDSVYLPDNIERIASKSFLKNESHGLYTKVFVKNGTKSLLSLWTADYEPYDKETGQVLIPYVNSRKISSSSLSVNVKYNYPEYFNYSISFNYDYWFNSKTDEGASFAMQGLDPGKKYTYSINVTLKDGSGRYYKQYEISTFAMKLVTQQPKVISVGNVIVAAQTNVDETEENVGFEWRRTDWSDDFASNTGGAYIFEGTMEGYIRNLNAEKLWKYRCYYLSRNGNYYYGDWVGLDPSNTSYFEPTVHTYKDVETTGNTALVRGYALRGTDGIKVQGFIYWRDVANTRRLAASVPSDAKTIEATGQVMTAKIDNLESGTKYYYAAFVTTTEGETFYGEQREFTTTDISGIEELSANSYCSMKESYYDINGHHLNKTKKGLNIVRMKDGKVRKIIVR